MSLVQLSEPVQTFDMRTRTKGGRSIWLNISILRMPPLETGGAGLTVHLCRDVTAAKALLTLVHERLAPAPPADAPHPASLLTRRELEVLQLMTQGLNTADAARRLHVSSATIRNHVQNIFGKLGVHSRLEAVAYAARHRLL
jgi:DNA-binding CsgD family transcriptional regulator